MGKTPHKAPPSGATGRKNMRAADRERQILTEAVRFFAECGFEGQTRELARRMGISHAVIYRHFETKEDLIERVYEHVYTSRWNSEWETLLVDRSRPLEERMVQFYLEYADRVFDYDWVRIFMFSGLKSMKLTERYLDTIRRKIIIPLAQEMRSEQGLDAAAVEITKEEEELFWGLHGSVFYTAIRKYVYNVPVSENFHLTVSNTVRNFFRGAKSF